MNSLRLLPRRIFAFVARDFRLFVSYRMQFFLRILSVLTIVRTLFFISKIFAGFTDPKFSQWRDPLANWLTGLAVLNYFMTGFSSLANSIRQEQMQGTLESVLLTPINLPTVIVASSAWDFLETTFFSFLYLFFGWVFFGVHYKGSFFLALVFLLLKTYAGPKLGNISLILPTTHGLDGIRQVLIEGHDFAQVTQPLIVLFGFLVVLLPFSLWVFGRAVKRAKREGSLIQY